VRFLVGRIRADNLTHHALAAVLINAAGNGFHLHDFCRLAGLGFFGKRNRSQQGNTNY
jgi:hypothetical protein